MARGNNAVLGALLGFGLVFAGACSDDEPALGGLGEACNIDVQCRGDMVCNVVLTTSGNPWKQCTRPCNAAADCGDSRADCIDMPTSMEAGVVVVKQCMLKCASNADCVHGTICNTTLSLCTSSDGAPVAPGSGTGGAAATGGAGGAATGGVAADSGPTGGTGPVVEAGPPEAGAPMDASATD
jgi:hypothetical protein